MPGRVGVPSFEGNVAVVTTLPQAPCSTAASIAFSPPLQDPPQP